MKLPKEPVSTKKRKRVVGDDHCDYLRHQKPVNRIRTDPVIVLSSILEKVVNVLRDGPDVQHFIAQVLAKVIIINTKCLIKKKFFSHFNF